MPTARANGIDIAYETFGAPHDPPLVLIMGLVTQMIGWPDSFCRMLARSGRYVIRFDNRDVGLSTKMDAMGVPDLERLSRNVTAGRDVSVPYRLEDMAADTWALLDALGISQANVCGLSMGGMIAQVMAIEQPGRVSSLICMETTTGEADLPPATPEAQEAFFSIPPVEREAYLEHMVGVYSAFGSHSECMDRDLQRRLTAAAFDRMWYPIGFSRQLAAVIAAPGRRRKLGALKIPVLVIHGDHDALFTLAHGQDIADAAIHSELVVVKGLGHGMAYPSLWDEMVGAIVKFSGR
jgi:pimeloyl-ACP methyl ester carboxylesterase